MWNFYGGNSPDPIGSICVDEATHLPFELQVGTLHVQYSYWNMPIQIIPPEMDMPAAVPAR